MKGVCCCSGAGRPTSATPRSQEATEPGRTLGHDEEGAVAEQLPEGVPRRAGGLALQTSRERGMHGESISPGQGEGERLVRQQGQEGGSAFGEAARIRLQGTRRETGACSCSWEPGGAGWVDTIAMPALNTEQEGGAQGAPLVSGWRAEMASRARSRRNSREEPKEPRKAARRTRGLPGRPACWSGGESRRPSASSSRPRRREMPARS